MFLVGATSQAANPQTYSNSNVYIGTDNCLYSNGTKVLTAHQSLSNYVTLNSSQTISATKTFSAQQAFTVAQGTAPFTVTSTTKVTNLNADYLDGLSSTDFAIINTSGTSGISKNSDLNDILTAGTYTCYDHGTASTLSNVPYTGGNFRLWHVINTKNNNGQWSSQIILAPSPARMFIRAYEENTFHGWKEFAFTTSNVASATKLQTARTLWGQSFNGTANVSGNLYMIDPAAANINQDSAKLKFNCYDSDETRRSPYIQALKPTSGNSYSRKRLGFFTSNAANYTDAFVEALSITPDANIGIGTTEPAYKLHIAGTGNVIGITPSSDSTYAGIIYNAVTDGYRWSFNTNKDKYYIWNGNLNREVFGISNAGTVQVNLPTISCSTAVGTAAKVATINGYTLETGNIVKIKFTKGNTSKSATLNISSTGAKGIRLDDGTAIASDTIAENDVVTMVYDGKYYRIKGINTDITDGYAAYVNGALAVRSLRFHGGTNGRIFSINGSGSITLKAPTEAKWAGGFHTYTHDGSTCLGGFGYYGSLDELTYLYIGNAYLTPWVTFLPSGDVGIGTTEPAYKLHVAGTVGTDDIITIKKAMSSGSNWTAGLLCLCPNMTANQHMQLFVGKAASNYNTGSLVYNHSADDSDSNSISIGMYGVNDIICAKGNGNVGVGTNSPAYKLDVQGTLGVNDVATIQSYINIDRVPYGALSEGAQLNILRAKSMNAGTGNYAYNVVISTFGSGETGTTVNNFPVRIGSQSGATWISAGESGKTFSDVNTGICSTENLYLTADGNM
jgi:hypothetical protein